VTAPAKYSYSLTHFTGVCYSQQSTDTIVSWEWMDL